MWERDSQVREVFEEFSGVDTTKFSLKRLPITGHSRTVTELHQRQYTTAVEEVPRALPVSSQGLMLPLVRGGSMY